MHASLALSHQLAPSRGLMARVGIWVVAFHGVALWLWVVGVDPTEVVKRPDISIEFYAPAAVKAEGEADNAESAAPPQPPAPRASPPPVRSPQQAASTPAPPPAAVADGAVATLTTRTPPEADAGPQEAPQSAPTEPSAAAPVIQTATTVDADYKAAYLNNPKPPYPASAVRRGAEGRVVLRAEVLADGRAGRVQLEQSSGHALLDASAMNTVRTWRFTPARKDGVIITQTVRIPIEFNLKEAR